MPPNQARNAATVPRLNHGAPPRLPMRRARADMHAVKWHVRQVQVQAAEQERERAQAEADNETDEIEDDQFMTASLFLRRELRAQRPPPAPAPRSTSIRRSASPGSPESRPAG